MIIHNPTPDFAQNKVEIYSQFVKNKSKGKSTTEYAHIMSKYTHAQPLSGGKCFTLNNICFSMLVTKVILQDVGCIHSLYFD
jgi:hypothetical protein